MMNIPDEVMMVINDPKTTKTIATRSIEGRIHTIYMGSMMAISRNQLVFAHILMKRTQQNIEEMKKKGELVSVLVTKEQTSYEVMAKVGEYQTSGPLFNRMMEELTRLGVKESLDKFGMRVLGVWTLEPVEVWNESPGPKAGTRAI